MKKIIAFLLFVSVNTFCFSQYMIVGKDSISLANFKKDYLYGLQNSGVAETVKTTQDFYLLQQFAEEKKADTTATFRNGMARKESELRNKLFLPSNITEPLLNQFINDNKSERKVLVFIKEKAADDKTDYTSVYNEVKSGKMSMEEAMKKYMEKPGGSFYVKPGSLDDELYSEIKTLPKNGYTKLFQTSKIVAFAQNLDSRPSLGYIVFGTISYANDAAAAKMKTDIYSALKSGKKFPEIAKLYGSSDAEKNNGGLVTGSPTLPDAVYAALKGKKEGEYSEPVLVGDKYFVFYIYSLMPYDSDPKNKEFYKSQMMRSQYGELAQKNLIEYLKKQPTYKESATYTAIQKSYASLISEKKSDAVLYSFSNHKLTVEDLQKLLTEKVKDADKLKPEEWKGLLSLINSQFVYNSYEQDFALRSDIKPELDAAKRNFYSEFIFSGWLKQQLATHPEWFTEYYNKNKSKYTWESRADGRVAILTDETLEPSIKKEIADPKNWDSLKKKYEGKANEKTKTAVNFENGEMSETADVFKKYNVPFKKGVFTTKMGTKTLVIAIDSILPPSQMTEKESEEYLKDGVSEEQLNSIIERQRAKTKIIVQPEFLKDLEKNFKK
ncbi:peptidylprolyl isomerase [Halpernia frigidisoli]|uniref:Peptidyl-prolyl cis-trans isomerase SurA n=1 Tax=Halpernia frigidisoli TaxID=1125876 RepID=A0A1I3ISQ1_9FLAO|nr:peptidylprolyl isomerase [Halpernia frigidisoli]SFI50969.1 peptidyl-prolyl cis-trans isomerase SurA [Halpernia frigidisoli]